MADPCDAIRRSIAGIQKQKAKLATQIANEQAAGIDTSPLRFESKLLDDQLQGAEAALQKCLQANAPAPTPQPLFVPPIWNEEGPGPTQIDDTGYSLAAGAVQAIACDPVNPERVFIGTVGGGIWFSDNARSPSPRWFAQTDHRPAVMIATIVMGRADPSGNTVYAGFGRTSHSSQAASSLGGILRTRDGGKTWDELASTTFQTFTVHRLLATGITTASGEVVLAATSHGLYRSTDGGAVWGPVAQFGTTAILDLAGEIGHPFRVYLATSRQVWRSEDSGDTNWNNITPPQLAGLSPQPTTLELSVCPVSDSSGNNWLYLGATNARTGGLGIFFTPDRGSKWQNAGTPPPGTGVNTVVGGVLVASSSLPTTFFCAADDVLHWMVDASTQTWTQIDRQAANNTGTHTDGREMMFSPDPNVLLEANDGGIYRLINVYNRAGQPPRAWEPMVDTLLIAEFYAIGYDNVHHVLFGGAQDNGVPHQVTPHSRYWALNEDSSSDMTCVGIDNNSVPYASIHYFSSHYLDSFARNTFTSPTAFTREDLKGRSDIVAFETARSRGLPFDQSWAINAGDPKRIIVGTDVLYESFDRGDSFHVIGGIKPPTTYGQVRTGGYAYGHAANPDVLYVCGDQLFVRRSGTGVPTVVTSYTGSAPKAVAIAPADWQRAYVVDEDNRIWRTIDAGDHWAELSGNLATLTAEVRRIAVYGPSAQTSDEVVFVCGRGGVFMTSRTGTGRFAFWQRFGTLPTTLATDLHFDAKDDILVIGTLGRSAHSVRNVSRSIVLAPKMHLVAQGGTSCFGGWLESSDFGFGAVLDGASLLHQPLHYMWNVVGAAPPPILDSPQVTITMPSAGAEVIVSLVVTDARGYQLFAELDDHTATEATLQLREKLCSLLQSIMKTSKFNWPIDPLGPPIHLGDPATARRTMGELHDLAGALTNVLGALAHRH